MRSWEGGREMSTMDKLCQTGKLQLLEDYISRLDDTTLRAELNNRAAPLGYTPLHVAALNGHAPVLGLLLSKGSDINARANSGSTPLHLAACCGHLHCVCLLMSRGADQTIKDNRGRTAADRNTATAVIRSEGNPHSSFVRNRYNAFLYPAFDRNRLCNCRIVG